MIIESKWLLVEYYFRKNNLYYDKGDLFIETREPSSDSITIKPSWIIIFLTILEYNKDHIFRISE